MQTKINIDTRAFEKDIVDILADYLKECTQQTTNEVLDKYMSSNNKKILDDYIDERINKALSGLFEGMNKKYLNSLVWYGRY